MKVEKERIEILKILIKYKFADKGTAESTADEIYNLFLVSENFEEISQKDEKAKEEKE